MDAVEPYSDGNDSQSGRSEPESEEQPHTKMSKRQSKRRHIKRENEDIKPHLSLLKSPKENYDSRP